MSDIRQLDRIEAKVDKLDERQDKMDTHMAVYNEQLKIHIAGVIDARARLEKLETTKTRIEGAAKVLGIIVGAIAGAVGLIAGLIAVIDFVQKLLGK